jgi:hypothetical protein
MLALAAALTVDAVTACSGGQGQWQARQPQLHHIGGRLKAAAGDRKWNQIQNIG